MLCHVLLLPDTPLKRKRLCSRGDSEDTSASVPSGSQDAAPPLSKAEKPAPRSKRSFPSVEVGDEQASCSKDCIGPSASSSGLCSKASSSDEEPEASREVPEVAQGQRAVPTPAKEKQTPIDSVVKNVEVIFRLLKK